QCAASEAEIDATFAAAQDKAKKSADKALAASTGKYKALQDAIQEYYSGHVTETNRQFDWSQEDLKTKSKTLRQRIVHEHDETADRVKKDLEQAIWLADSVLEAAEIRIKEEYQKAQEAAANAVQTLDQLEEKATNTLIKLNQPTPPAGPDLPEPTEALPDPATEYDKHRILVEDKLSELNNLRLPRMTSGGKIWVFGAMGCLALTAGAYLMNMSEPNYPLIASVFAVTSGALVLAALYLGTQARKQVIMTYSPLRQSLIEGRRAIEAMKLQSDLKRQTDSENAARTRKAEAQAAKEKFTPMFAQAAEKRDSQVLVVRNDASKQLVELEKKRDATIATAARWNKEIIPKVRRRGEREVQAVRDRFDSVEFENHCKFEKSREKLERTWADGLATIREPIGDGARASADWSQTDWEHWIPPKQFAETVRFGEIQVDLKKIVEQAAPEGKFTLPIPDAFSLPALLAFPRQSSLMIHHDPSSRREALAALQMVMTRLLTSLPPGRVRFTMIDPVGLGQNFAGFMHLTDYDDKLVGVRAWTGRDHIEQRLADLTEHMETVIQKYLRNEYETIDQYNAQAGELAEPYQFLVIADFPQEFEADALRRLSSVAATGARCGVYTLIARDTRLTPPSGAHFDDIESHSVNLVRKDGKFVWKDEVFQQFPLALDPPPEEETLTKIMHVVGKGAKEASRVEVPFESITPKGQQFWSRNSASSLEVPVGRTGATRLQYVRLGRGVAQHGLIAGKTGSGKSSLLNALITNTAMWYPPDQVVMYLIDFKKGVEFKTYATHLLPHAKAIAVESDREFGLSVLQRIDLELTRRGELYRKLGVQDLAAYRETDNPEPMPRTLLIIDEFQEFFSEDDKLAQEAVQLMDRLVRQGRAFGIHVLLGSQTLAGSSGLPRSTIGQMGVRVALQCTEADSQLILGDNNSAARLLSRPGEAIYNDAGGLVEGNSPFQVAWLPDEKREESLQQIQRASAKIHFEPPIVFEGNAPAPIDKNVALVRLLEDSNWGAIPNAPVAWLGDPVAIKPPTAVPFRRQSGANLLMIGQQEEAAMGMMASVLVSLASQLSRANARFYIFDGSAVDSPLNKVLPQIRDMLPHDVKIVEFRAVGDAVNEIATELQKRQDVEPTQSGHIGDEIFCFVYGVQRYRQLRKEEESFSFSASDEEKKPSPGKQFADILREGPGLGIHTVAWVDTPASLDRILERQAMREFDFRVLFQMSANDSSNLIDSPAANKLGANRALVYSEEQGTMEKFRPYALPDQAWLERVKNGLGAKKAITD
ncbi:MAG TPA: FtsK/SpoIIIE domain-containing protein, partial [Tepidisphaeraceae bacterium]|nr:FtsK/SpoIIIE domain-containing protein [Tepidisphaeraceae bacterium]